MLSTPTVERTPHAIMRAVDAIHVHRPTRVVIAIPTLIDMAALELEHAQWLGRTRGVVIALFQNELAEAVSPCRHRMEELSKLLTLDWQEWRVNVRPWPRLSRAALSLQRRPQTEVRVYPEWRRYFDAGSDINGHTMPFGRHARAALHKVGKLSTYTRRLGVVPESYGCVLADAMYKATGNKPSLKAVSAALESVRTSMWDAACASFRAAHAARVWVYDNDPEDRLNMAEDDRRAQKIFERRRDKARGIQRGRRLRGGRKNGTATASTPRRAEVPRRRSLRGRVQKKDDSAYCWNYSDDYVQALDEVDMDTKRSMKRDASTRAEVGRTLASLI
jgi:hypothetical protein